MPLEVKEELNDWYKIKRYPHIGLPSNNNSMTISYIKNQERIAVHSFTPFIHKVISTRRYRKEYDSDGKVKDNGKRVNKGAKKRSIHYANHLDSNIYAYYSCLLNKRYETILEEKDLKDVVTAYRKTPTDVKQKNLTKKNNIQFADEVFKYIKTHAIDNEVVAITFDIENFFPSLDHSILKNRWCEVIGEKALPKDHYNVFRNITKFSYVEEQHLFKLFKNKILVRKNDGKIVSQPVKRIDHLYNKNAIGYCSMKDIHTIRKKGLIRANKYTDNGEIRVSGICQGSAISATLANIYMLGFDELIHREISNLNGIYRRYSDDMVVVCPIKYKTEVIELFKEKVEDIKLITHKDKTQVFHFNYINNRLICEQEFNGVLTQYSINRNFEYLGFSFDGENVYLKTSSLAKYYRKMKKGVHRSGFYSSTINNSTKGEMFKRRLYKRYSYIGSTRCIKYKRIQGTTNQWQPDKHAINWGNYITYAKNAHKIMSDYSKIDSQIKNHWKNLNQEIHRSKP